MILRRAAQWLVPPATVTLHVRGSRLRLRGEATPQWISTASEQANRLAGVATVDLSGLRPLADPLTPQRAELVSLLTGLRTMRVDFSHDVVPVDTAVLDAMAAKASRGLRLAEQLQDSLRYSCHGYHDSSGSAAINQRLRLERAAWLCAELARRGVVAELPDASDATDTAQSEPEAGRTAMLRASLAAGAAGNE